MAKAADQHTPIKDLDGLLRYLTVELGYEKYDALWEMEQRYLDGTLRLKKHEYDALGRPQGDAVVIDAKYGHLEFDRHSRMQVVPRIGFEWREVRYTLDEQCDVRAIWPAPSAAQPSQESPKPEAEGWQVRHVKEALKEKFPPDGHPPVDMPRKTILDRVNEFITLQGWKPASGDSLARAMGRRRT